MLAPVLKYNLLQFDSPFTKLINKFIETFVTCLLNDALQGYLLPLITYPAIKPSHFSLHSLVTNNTVMDMHSNVLTLRWMKGTDNSSSITRTVKTMSVFKYNI